MTPEEQRGIFIGVLTLVVIFITIVVGYTISGYRKKKRKNIQNKPD